MKKSRYTASQILVTLKQADSGTQVPELCCGHEISSASFYNGDENLVVWMPQ